MAGYLEGYGAGDARRERITRRIVLAAVAVAATGTGLYFYFRNYREKQQVQDFLALLRNKDYQAAYRLWGCSDERPCPDYAFSKFMEDWGPASSHADAAAAKVAKTRSCRSGIIQTVQFPNNEEVLMWVERSNLTLGFAPWPVCDPRIPASSLSP